MNINQKKLDYLRHNTVLGPIAKLKIRHEEKEAEALRQKYMKLEPHDLIETDLSNVYALEYALRMKLFEKKYESMWKKNSDGASLEEFCNDIINSNIEKLDNNIENKKTEFSNDIIDSNKEKLDNNIENKETELLNMKKGEVIMCPTMWIKGYVGGKDIEYEDIEELDAHSPRTPFNNTFLEANGDGTFKDLYTGDIINTSVEIESIEQLTTLNYPLYLFPNVNYKLLKGNEKEFADVKAKNGDMKSASINMKMYYNSCKSLSKYILEEHNERKITRETFSENFGGNTR